MATFTISSWSHSQVYVISRDKRKCFCVIKISKHILCCRDEAVHRTGFWSGFYLLREVLTSVFKWKGPDRLEHGPGSTCVIGTDAGCLFCLLFPFCFVSFLDFVLPQTFSLTVLSPQLIVLLMVLLSFWCGGKVWGGHVTCPLKVTSAFL